MIPFRYEEGIPIFTNNQIDDYGFPEHWGFEIYQVIDNRDTIALKTDYKMEQSYYKRPIHRYDRKARFQTILGQLLGDKGKVPAHVLTIVGAYLKPGDEWNQVRRILKHYRLRIYYNRIPYIIQQLTKINSSPKIHADQYRSILQDFDRFCFLYENEKTQFKRTYFPNMRFMALKLIEKNGIVLNYPIPSARTNRKQKELNEIWNWFISQ